MSDFAAVILEVVQDECDAFWCFVSLMDDLGQAQNFDQNEQGMHHLLRQTTALLRHLDPGLIV